MAIETVPEWMAGLEDEDVAFIKKFLLASGSLKEVAGLYGVTYPTVRLRQSPRPVGFRAISVSAWRILVFHCTPAIPSPAFRAKSGWNA